MPKIVLRIECPYQTCNRGDKISCGSKVSHILRLKNKKTFCQNIVLCPLIVVVWWKWWVASWMMCYIDPIIPSPPLHRVIKRSQWHQPNTRQWDLLDMHLLSQCTMSLGRTCSKQWNTLVICFSSDKYPNIPSWWDEANLHFCWYQVVT